ncbi:MAG: hypothetical protein ABL970_02220 [Nitrospira sp.]
MTSVASFGRLPERLDPFQDFRVGLSGQQEDMLNWIMWGTGCTS